MMCRCAKFSVIDSLTPISIFSNFRFALSYVTSSDSSAILVSARHAPERDPISITIFSISCSSSITLVNACHACNESSTKLRSCNRSSSAHEVPDSFTIISESSAESTLLTQAHVRKRCKKLTRLARPRNSGTVECMNIRILVDGAGALSSCSCRRRRTDSPLHLLLDPCKFFFGNVCNQLVQGIASGIVHLSSSTTEVPRRRSSYVKGSTGPYAKRVS